MRTITEIMLARLKLQADEAKVLGLVKTASNLEHEVSVYKDNTRPNDSFYSYAQKDLESDVQKHLWDAVIRVADFYGGNIDGRNVQNIIEVMSERLIDDIKIEAGASHGVGIYEDGVPGEVKENVVIELGED